MNKIILQILLILLFSTDLFAEEKSLKDAEFDFQQKLYNKIKQSEGNLIFSPLSIYSALSMAYLGADGTTKNEFENILSIRHELLNDISSTNQILLENDNLVLANAFFTDEHYQFLESYQEELDDIFDIEAQSVDFKNNPNKATKIINSWVEDKTENLIKDLIPPNSLNNLTRGVLVNTIYFNGKWQHKFNSKLTSKSEFTKLDGKSQTTEFLNATFETKYFEDSDHQAIELPYADSSFSMLIILPKAKTKESFLKLENDFNENFLSNILNNLNQSNTEIKIPKFKAEFQIFLSEALKQIGLNSAFDELNANFSKMSTEKGLHISEVIHKAYIEVEEEGTKAAAATSVIMLGRSLARAPEDLKKFRADHPFLYFIRDSKSGLILFAGRYSPK